MRYFFGAAAALLLTSQMRADVTIRYKSETHTVTPIPFPAADLGMDYSIAMKGHKGRLTSARSVTIADFDKRQVTLLDTTNRKYATIPVAEYTSKMEALLAQFTPGPLPEAQGILAGVKSKTSTRKTGRTETILGVQSEEPEATLSMELPMPAGTPAVGSLEMKMVMTIWSAQPDEILRVPGIRELMAFDIWQQYTMNPVGMFEKIVPAAMGESLTKFFNETAKDKTVVMRTGMTMYMTAFGALAQAQPGAPVDNAAEPFMEMKQAVEEFSTNDVDAALFEIPKDYTAAPFEEVFRSSMPELQ